MDYEEDYEEDYDDDLDLAFDTWDDEAFRRAHPTLVQIV